LRIIGDEKELPERIIRRFKSIFCRSLDIIAYSIPSNLASEHLTYTVQFSSVKGILMPFQVS